MVVSPFDFQILKRGIHPLMSLNDAIESFIFSLKVIMDHESGYYPLKEQ